MHKDSPTDPLARVLERWLLAGLLAVILLAVVHFAYADPLADDFCRGARIRQLGPIGAMRHEYDQWQGRWAGFGTACLATTLTDITRWYPALLIAAALVFLACVHFFLCTVLRLGLVDRRALILTAGLIVLYWSGMPSTGEGFYWFPAATEYHGAVALWLLVTALLLRSDGSGRRPRLWPGLVLAALGVVAAGLHELFAAIMCCVLVIGAATTMVRRRSVWRLWLSTAVAAGVGLAVVFLAPGNSVRQACFPLAKDLARALRLSTSQAGFMADFVRNGGVLAASVILLLSPSLEEVRAAWSRRVPGRWGWAVPGAGVALLAGILLPSGWFTGMDMPYRLSNIAFFVLLATWLLSVLRLSDSRLWRWVRKGMKSKVPLYVSLAVFPVAVMLSLNVRRGIGDLGGCVQAYHSYMINRNVYLEQSAMRGQRSARPDAFTGKWPSAYYGTDMTDDPNHWVNMGVAEYYGLDDVAVRRW